MPKLEIAQFICRSDNFGVLIHDPASRQTTAIDAPDGDAVEKAARQRGWKISHILVTHKHLDHIEGIPTLKQSYSCEVVGPAKSASETGLYDKTVKSGDAFRWAGREIRVIDTPGHTLDHISYFIPDEKLVFVGDTIFALGCGRVIEGTHPMMWDSLKRLRALPDDTSLYCGHEYTLANAKFAVTVDPDNAALKARKAEVERQRAAREMTLPTTIGREKAENPFLRADDAGLAQHLGMATAEPAKVFAEIRMRKDRF